MFDINHTYGRWWLIMIIHKEKNLEKIRLNVIEGLADVEASRGVDARKYMMQLKDKKAKLINE